MKKVLVLGAGQLARMMDLVGSPLGMDVKAFDVRTNEVVHPISPEYHQVLYISSSTRCSPPSTRCSPPSTRSTHVAAH